MEFQDNTFGKDFFISVNKPKNLVVVCKNPNTHLRTLEDMEDMRKRYLYEVGHKILTPFGIQTIKEIIYDYGTQHGYEWLILVEENKNQYKPCELIGIVENVINLEELTPLLGVYNKICINDIKLTSIDMSVRLYNCLYKQCNFKYMSDIHKFIDINGIDEFIHLRNFGERTMKELKELVIKYPVDLMPKLII